MLSYPPFSGGESVTHMHAVLRPAPWEKEHAVSDAS